MGLFCAAQLPGESYTAGSGFNCFPRLGYTEFAIARCNLWQKTMIFYTLLQIIDQQVKLAVETCFVNDLTESAYKQLLRIIIPQRIKRSEPNFSYYKVHPRRTILFLNMANIQ
jgi:hypothetical protein